MRIDNVNPNKGIGFIKFNSDTEIDLIGESLDLLIKKQEKLLEKTPHDTLETEKLERYKKSKDVMVEIPKQNRLRLQGMRNVVKNKNEEQNKKMMAIGQKEKVVEDFEDTQDFKNMNRVITNAEDGSGMKEGTEVTRRNVYVLANALNEHINQMETIGLRTARNKIKHAKLQQLLAATQEQKAKFERIRPKPTGWGRLRK